MDYKIGGNVKLAKNVYIGNNVIIEDDVVLGNNVSLGNNVVVRKGAIVGDNAIIGYKDFKLGQDVLGELVVTELGEGVRIRSILLLYRWGIFKAIYRKLSNKSRESLKLT